ncbi:MAG: ABC transporter permease [Acetobacteraceae bacterium]
MRLRARPRRQAPEGATLQLGPTAAGLTLAFGGRLDAAGVGELWATTLRAAAGAKDGQLEFDLSAVVACDTAGAALLVAAENAHGQPARLVGANEALTALLFRMRAALPPPRAKLAPSPPPPFRPFLGSFAGAANGLAFLGESIVAVIVLPRRLRMLRASDVLSAADQAGVRAMPLILLLGFLIGLILAFQAAVPMQMFGAVVYVAKLVSISLFRELGPLLAAIILAGRTASAFAAEIGTMKVNEEVDALSTMGLDPMTMLVLPRLIAAVAVMPMLTIGIEVAGLVGMAVVMKVFGYPLAEVMQQVRQSVTVGDFVGGLVKGLCFAAVIAAIGCNRGLTTGRGPRAVGVSTTAAVVGGIVAAIVLDGAFALIFYQLDL